MEGKVICGIDIGKYEHIYQIGKSGKTYRVKNEIKAIEALILKLKKSDVGLVVMEATGGYQRTLVLELWKAKINISVVNPRKVKSFNRSLGYAKTDQIDAASLVLYGEKMDPKHTPEIPSEVLELQALMTRREQLVKIRTAEKNHLKDPVVHKEVLSLILQSVKSLKSQIKNIENLMLNIIKKHPTLKDKFDILSQHKGVGKTLALQLIANLPELGILNRSQIAALVGVAPYNNDSSTFEGTRNIKGGRTNVRNTLYMATVTAIRCNQKVKPYFIALVKRGKPKMVALVAAMRKFLLILNATLKQKFA